MIKELSLNEYNDLMMLRNQEEGFFDDETEEGGDEPNNFYNDDIEKMVLAFVDYVGVEAGERRLYDFYFTTTPTTVWGPDWNVTPSGACGKILPDPTTYNTIKRLKTVIPLVTAQESSCFSMQDCIDGCISICYEDISNYEQYPEDGRLVFNFGESFESVENKLAARFQMFAE
jgi:hypothetical protein